MQFIDIFLLKKHPHIYANIEYLWGSKELYHYINKLLLDARDGKRAGFDPQIASVLYQILDLHYEEEEKTEIDWFIHL